MRESNSVVTFGREVCGDLASASAREWLVASGNGAFACGTIDGSLTRKYHGLLFAALIGPAARTLFFVKVDEFVTCGDVRFALATNRWRGGAIEPQGYRALERFSLDGTTPVWSFESGGVRLERRVTLEPGSNAAVLRYIVRAAPAALTLEVKAIVDERDFHGNTHDRGGPPFVLDERAGGVRVRAPFESSAELFLVAQSGTHELIDAWYRGYDLPAERERGLDDSEDHLCAASFRAELVVGAAWALRATAQPRATTESGATKPAAGAVGAGETFARREARETVLLRMWEAAQPACASAAPPAIRQLVLAADQFVVTRSSPEGAEGHSIVAGYPWFGDWGRDAMIALPGLLLVTGRHALARSVLRTFGRLIDGGMLPNTIPDRGPASYNTIDAALWFVDAVRAYYEAARDIGALAKFFPLLVAVVDGYVAGTRYGIGVDPVDDLVTGGEAGVQLTWMDAKVDGRVITPRAGKPVEINALWYNALATLAYLAPVAGHDPEPYSARAARVRMSFARYLGGREGGLLDVLDGPNGNDAALRPNQIFAVSLAFSPLDPDDARAVVDVCSDRLLTPFGLRSLAPDEPAYVGRYEGGVPARDGAYHQGTVWGWLAGPFAVAHARAYGDRSRARAFLEPLLAALDGYGLGTLGEIFDGDAPHTPRGALAQAWTVGEVLRAWHELA